MSESSRPPSDRVILPEGEKIIHRSELFRVRIRSKQVVLGMTRDQHLLTVDILEQDPMVQREAVVEVDPLTYGQVEARETVLLRLYEQPGGTWTVNPPVLPILP